MKNFLKFICVIAIILFVVVLTHSTNLPPIEPEQGAVCFFTFDDGYSSMYEFAKPIMDSLGFKGNCFIICDWIGGGGDDPKDEGVMSWNQLSELHNNGWGIYNHSKHHGCSDSSQINSCYWCLKNWGFDANVFAYPFGIYTPQIIEWVSLYHVAARTDHEGLQDHFNIWSSGRYELKAISVLSNVPVDTVKFWIDRAIESNKVIILIYHGFCDTEGCAFSHRTYIENFREVLNYLYEKREQITVMTFKEYLGI